MALHTLSGTLSKDVNHVASLRYVQAMKATYASLLSTCTHGQWADQSLSVFIREK